MRSSLSAAAVVLLGQDSHCAAPAGDHRSAAQPMHCSRATAPGEDERKPASHFEHVVAPRIALYDPAEQRRHVELASPMLSVRKPAKQWQSERWSLPVTAVELPGQAWHVLDAFAPIVPENVLFGHSVHVCPPSLLLYVPDTHGTHVGPVAAVNPGRHEQLPACVLPAGDFEFSGHSVHADVASAGVVEYVFAGHSVHVPFPGSIL